MSNETTIGDIVALSAKGDASGVKSAIGDALQQKVMVSLEGKKQEFAKMNNNLYYRTGGSVRQNTLTRRNASDYNTRRIIGLQNEETSRSCV